MPPAAKHPYDTSDSRTIHHRHWTVPALLVCAMPAVPAPGAEVPLLLNVMPACDHEAVASTAANAAAKKEANCSGLDETWTILHNE